MFLLFKQLYNLQIHRNSYYFIIINQFPTQIFRMQFCKLSFVKESLNHTLSKFFLFLFIYLTEKSGCFSIYSEFKNNILSAYINKFRRATGEKSWMKKIQNTSITFQQNMKKTKKITEEEQEKITKKRWMWMWMWNTRMERRITNHVDVYFRMKVFLLYILFSLSNFRLQ